jgi:choloylglycine hydrolase
MKCQALFATLAAAIVAVLNSGADACTGIRLIAKDGGVVVGRTMEFGFDVKSNVIVVPSGTKLTNSLPDKSQGMQYTSKYGVVGANILGMKVIVDGVNEKGLYVGGFYFPGYASYADPDSKNAARALAPEDYGVWLLANFASVEEVKANFDKVVLVPNPIKEIGGESFPGHFVVHDSSGACVVIEPVNKTLKIHDNPLGAMSNSPAFDWHITNLRNYINLTATNVPPVAVGDIKRLSLVRVQVCGASPATSRRLLDSCVRLPTPNSLRNCPRHRRLYRKYSTS